MPGIRVPGTIGRLGVKAKLITPTNRQYVDRLLWLINNIHPWYSQQEPRCSPTNTHHCDCSGFCCWGLQSLGVPYPCSNSWNMAIDGHVRNLGISIDEALRTPGCWLIKGANEGQTDIDSIGHVGASIGDGVHSAEARGTFAGVHVFEADDIEWSYAMMVPFLKYGTKPPPIVPPTQRFIGEGEVYVLPGQKNDNFRPVGVMVWDHKILLFNVSKNPFKEGKIAPAMNGNGHQLILTLAEGEEVIGASDRRPDGTQCPPAQPIEIYTNLPAAPDNKGQPRHVLKHSTMVKR